MDEITLITALRPAQSPAEAEQAVRAARARLTAAYTARRRRRPVMLAAGAAVLAGTALTAVMAAWPTAPSRTESGHRMARIVTAAWTVGVNQNQTVTITVSQLRDPAGLQRALRQEGIPALVRYTPLVTVNLDGQEVTGPACEYHWPSSALLPAAVAQRVIVPESGPTASPRATTVCGSPAETTPLFVFTIHPEALPQGAVVFIAIAMSGPTPAHSAPIHVAAGLSVLATDHLPRCVPLAESLRHT